VLLHRGVNAVVEGGDPVALRLEIAREPRAALVRNAVAGIMKHCGIHAVTFVISTRRLRRFSSDTVDQCIV
jgi:hypothetical protein